MLENIRSLTIKKKLFSFIDEKQKLEIIKSNKSLQKNLNISIINYKFLSGKYINYESKGKGKEYNGYNDGKLIFEGEYLNGKRNGKGKEYYYNGNLLFEGEYINNIIYNGKGYDENGNIIYELINGNGKVKEYNVCGKLIFEGEYLNGKNGTEML